MAHRRQEVRFRAACRFGAEPRPFKFGLMHFGVGNVGVDLERATVVEPLAPDPEPASSGISLMNRLTALGEVFLDPCLLVTDRLDDLAGAGSATEIFAIARPRHQRLGNLGRRPVAKMAVAHDESVVGVPKDESVRNPFDGVEEAFLHVRGHLDGFNLGGHIGNAAAVSLEATRFVVPGRARHARVEEGAVRVTFL